MAHVRPLAHLSVATSHFAASSVGSIAYHVSHLAKQLVPVERLDQMVICVIDRLRNFISLERAALLNRSYQNCSTP